MPAGRERVGKHTPGAASEKSDLARTAPAPSSPPLLDLQRSIGNAGVVALLNSTQPDPPATTVNRYPMPGRPALYLDDRRSAQIRSSAQIRRKVGNLPKESFQSPGVIGSIRAKVGSKSPKQVDFEAIQAEVTRYNEEKGGTAEDLGRHRAQLEAITRMVSNWLTAYGKEGADDLAHRKQAYMRVTLPQALEAETKANNDLKPAPPRGAERGVVMPGMAPAPRAKPKLPPPLPPPLPASPPPPLPQAESKEPAGDGPAPRQRRLPPPLPAHVPFRPPPAEEYTDFQNRIVAAHDRLAEIEDDDEATVASRLFVNELYDNIAQFSQSILAGRVDESGRPIAGTAIRDKNRLDAILSAITKNKEAVYSQLGIEPPDEKELGLEGISERVQRANDAISALGAITPAIAKNFQDAAVKTNRIGKAKGYVGAAVGIGLGHAPVPGLGHAFSAAMAIKKVQSTVRHLRRLKRIRVLAASNKNTDMVDLLDYIIAKKEAKKVKAGVGGVPLVATLSSVGFKAKGLWKMAKGTRGEGRKAAAKELIDGANGGDAEAQLVIMELVDDLEEYKQVLLGGLDGREILANKMKSK